MTTVHEPTTTTTSAALSVWPASATESRRGDLHVGEVSLAEIADRFGTPAYVLDETEVRDRCRTYRDAFPDAEILYAAKAFLCRAMAHWVDEAGLGLDVRVVPGISAGGNDKIRTGTEDQKFGLSIADGYAQHAVARILDQPRLELNDLYCHLGSRITWRAGHPSPTPTGPPGLISGPCCPRMSASSRSHAEDEALTVPCMRAGIGEWSATAPSRTP